MIGVSSRPPTLAASAGFEVHGLGFWDLGFRNVENMTCPCQERKRLDQKMYTEGDRYFGYFVSSVQEAAVGLWLH